MRLASVTNRDVGLLRSALTNKATSLTPNSLLPYILLARGGWRFLPPGIFVSSAIVGILIISLSRCNEHRRATRRWHPKVTRTGTHGLLYS